MKAVQAGSVLFVFWLALTASFKPWDLGVGLLLSVLLGLWAARSLWADDAPVLTWRQALRFAAYVPWLIKEIIKAALGVAEVVLSPRMPIDPRVIGHRVVFKRPVCNVALANSITLTPGTLTVDVDGDITYVHCLNEGFADGIVNGDMERRIVRVFEE